MLGLTKTRKSLADILSTFTKAIEDLDALAAANSEEIIENNSTIVELQESNLKLIEESASAEKVRGRLNELIA